VEKVHGEVARHAEFTAAVEQIWHARRNQTPAA